MDKKWCSGPLHPRGLWLDVEEFSKNRTRVDGLQVYCKNCEAVYRARGKAPELNEKRHGRRVLGTPGARRRLERWRETDRAEERLRKWREESG